jgi:hypothetical protein
MICPGARLRQRYQERMQQVAVGAQLVRRTRVWHITKQHRTDTGLVLQLRHGRRDFQLYVGVTLDGPELWTTRMRSAGLPPAQREMFAGGSV